LESELFGHVKGAFSGASAPKGGYIQAAEGGTLFLDEIGETTPEFQVRLLRVLEDRMVVPVGSTQGRRVDFRLVAATHRDLSEGAAQGTFNQALLYRIKVVPLWLPPLRERPEDLPLLLDHFLGQACLLAKKTRQLAPETRQALLAYDWPGNVRELSHVLQRLVVLSEQYDIKPDLLPAEFRKAPAPQAELVKRYQENLDMLAEIPGPRRPVLARMLAEAKGGDLTNKSLRERLGCSDSTAKNILRALSQAGVLEPYGRRGGRRYRVGKPKEV